MKTIARNTEIIPGVPYVYAIPISFINVINNGSILFTKPIAEILYAFQKATDSDSSSTQAVVTDSGTHYACNVNLFIPGLSLENISLFKELGMYRHMIIFQTYTGEYWRLGNKSHGLIFTYQQTTDPQIGYHITFYGNLLEAPQQVNEASIFPA